MGTIEKVAVFFSTSAIRKNMLQIQAVSAEGSKVSDGDNVEKQTRSIPQMSDTRWGSRGKTVGAFVENLGAVHSALQEIKSGTSQSSEKASRLRHSIKSFDHNCHLSDDKQSPWILTAIDKATLVSQNLLNECLPRGKRGDSVHRQPTK